MPRKSLTCLVLAILMSIGIECGLADNKENKGDFFVFVPLPCPSQEDYDAAQTFMDQICNNAAKNHFKVIVVRSCYNDPKNLEDQAKRWWHDATVNLPVHYHSFITEGLVIVTDEIPDLPLDYTPQGFFYHSGKLLWHGELNSNAPSAVLAEAVAQLDSR